jgi:dTDP-4-amino-4,6-dideoxygalactose transaminase
LPLHRQDVYRADNARASFPAADAAAEQVLSLPMYPELTEAQIDEVVRVVRQARA